MNGVRWWQMPVATIDGRRVLDCHYANRRHRAVIVDEHHRRCDGAGCARIITGHAWATLDRERVLCGRCHTREHAADDEQRANAADAYTPPDAEQLTLGDAH